MNKVALLIAVLCCTAALVASQAMPRQRQHFADAADDNALSLVAEQWKDAYNAGDPEKVAALYAEDATYLTQHFVTGIVHGRPAIRAYVKNGTDAKYKVDFLKILSTQCSGDFAYTITRYESTNGTQKAFGVNLVVLRKINGKWMIVAHDSAVPDTATAIQKLEIKEQTGE
jgi:uncharacterized protein (TIGR02246 family)